MSSAHPSLLAAPSAGPWSPRSPPAPAPAQTPVLSPRSCSTGWPSDLGPEEEPCRAHTQVRGFATTPDRHSLENPLLKDVSCHPSSSFPSYKWFRDLVFIHILFIWPGVLELGLESLEGEEEGRVQEE